MEILDKLTIIDAMMGTSKEKILESVPCFRELLNWFLPKLLNGFSH